MTTPLTDAQLAELQRLLDKATPEPWTLENSVEVVAADDRHVADAWWDQDLIAASRTALPLLLAEVRRLLQVEAEWHEVMQKMARMTAEDIYEVLALRAEVARLRSPPSDGARDAREGGAWLAAARNWMKWNCHNGSIVRWGSDVEMVPAITARQVDEIALAAVEADRRERSPATDARDEEIERLKAEVTRQAEMRQQWQDFCLRHPEILPPEPARAIGELRARALTAEDRTKAALSSAESARRVVEDLVRLSEGAMRDANRDGAEYHVEECLAEARAFLAGERGEVGREG